MTGVNMWCGGDRCGGDRCGDDRITSVALRYKLRAVRISGHVNKGQDIGDMGGRGGTVWSSGADRSCTSTSVGH
ncbi:hypothetical protein Pcinc_028678 [Petrolisthes cinctipes]|uniref:Uncharacterized protein n=1 Tax=Petrolisthes cinctipes TaxID=88211 RepID=A0AAE1F370_PETCI|nr:hypothetical protein Pcinc_028678 [Petrolisthes cinctipes]